MRGIEQAKQSCQRKTPIGTFREMTDTFKLDVELFDGSISISLEDYVGWVHYARQYTDDDVGKQIHKKMDISELFISFSQTQTRSDDETEMQNKQRGIFTNVQKYTFGTVVKNGQYPCYKVDKGGRITAYMPLMHSGLKKQIVYQSVLQLDKKKDMTQMQIFVQSSSRQKRQLSQEFGRELQIMKKQKASYLTKIDKLQSENKTMKTELANLKQQTEQSSKRLKQEVIRQLKQEIKKEVTASLVAPNNQINQLRTNLNNDRNANNQKFTTVQSQLKNQVVTSFAKFTSYHLMESLPQLWNGKFKIQGFQCTLNTAEGSWTQLLFNKFIPLNENFIFKIKVTRSAGKAFMIGVVDYQKQKDQRSSYGSGNANCYYSAGNCKYPSGTGQGSGFVQNEIIEVNVHRATKTIKWSVNGTQRSLDNTFGALAEAGRIFVPYIEMSTNNDALEWIP